MINGDLKKRRLVIIFRIWQNIDKENKHLQVTHVIPDEVSRAYIAGDM